MTEIDCETQRIASEYERRRREIADDFYALSKPANLFLRHSQEFAFQRALIKFGLIPLADKRILEVGCGTGQWFTFWQNLGAQPATLSGIELDANRAAESQRLFPQADIQVGDARELPWSNASFDIVFQSTVFTSVLDANYQTRIASEMLRVLKPGGLILWYDFQYNNPRNPNVRGIGRQRISQLFPDCRMKAWRCTLAPPLARRVAPWSRWFAGLLESIRFLNTHLVVGIIKPN